MNGVNELERAVWAAAYGAAFANAMDLKGPTYPYGQLSSYVKERCGDAAHETADAAVEALRNRLGK